MDEAAVFRPPRIISTGSDSASLRAAFHTEFVGNAGTCVGIIPEVWPFERWHTGYVSLHAWFGSAVAEDTSQDLKKI